MKKTDFHLWKSVFLHNKSARRGSNHTAFSPTGQNEKCLQLSTTFWRTQKAGTPCKSREFQPLKKSARRDSNSTNIGKATKIKEERTLSTVCLQAVYNLEIREESCQGVCGADTFYPFTACYRG